MASTPRGNSFQNPTTSASPGVAAVVALLQDEQRTLSMPARNVAFEGDGSALTGLTSAITYDVGDFAQGGIVFWVEWAKLEKVLGFELLLAATSVWLH